MSPTETDASDLADASAEETQEEKTALSIEVKVEEPSACERHVAVTVSREDIDRYFENAVGELLPKAEVPGFRPGRAPRKLVEARFRDELKNQVKGSLLMDCMTQVSEEHDFSAISEPDFDLEAIEIPDDGPLTFEFDLEVRPEFDMPQWKGMKLKRPEHEYTDEDVDRQLNKLLERYAEQVETNAGAEPGDYVDLDMTFSLNGDALSETTQAVRLQPKLSFPDATLEDFDKLMAGAKVGDTRTATVSISAEADNESLREKQVDVAFTVTGVRKLKLPSLNRQFLDSIGGFEDEADLRSAVREELDRQLRYYQQKQVRQQITALLTQSASWQLPPELLRRQGGRELRRAIMELQTSGFSHEQIRAHENEIRQNSLANTSRALKEHFILERIAEEENIEATPEDFDAEISLIAWQKYEPVRRVRARMEKRGEMDALRNQIIERKVIDVITENAEFETVPFEPKADDTAAVNHVISGGTAAIPEALHGGDAQSLPTQADHS